MSKLDIVDRLESLGGCDPACYGRCKVCPDEVARDGAKEITALRTKLAEAIVVHNRSITRMVEMAEPGFIGAFAARDMAIERAEKAEAELAACSAAFDKQQKQLDRNAEQIAILRDALSRLIEVHDAMGGKCGTVRIAAEEALLGKAQSEYICTCGIRVTPHRCPTDSDF